MKINKFDATNFITVNAENVSAINSVVAAFQLDMALIIDEAAKSRLDTRIADEKGVLSEKKKAALEEDRDALILEIQAEKSALRKVESARKTVIDDLVKAGNDKTAVENLFRVLACYNNKSFNKYALRGVCTSWTDELDSAMNTAHSLKFSEKTGARVMGKDEKTAFTTAMNIIKSSIRGVCAVAENSYFGKVSVNINATDLAALHETFVTGISLEYKTDKKTGKTTQAEDYTISTRIRRSRGKNTKIDASEFWAVAVVCILKHICK